jgi:hypothetical protein
MGAEAKKILEIYLLIWFNLSQTKSEAENRLIVKVLGISTKLTLI